LATTTLASVKVRDPLLGAELDPDAFVGGIDHRKGAAAEQAHVADPLRDAAEHRAMPQFGNSGDKIRQVAARRRS
jgi:hypothetical protein